MADLCLASAGDDVKLWDGKTFSFIKAFNYHSSPVSSISWSFDNSILVSASESGDKVVLTYPDNTDSAASVTIAENEGVKKVSFNSSARYVLGGCTSGLVHIWDLKTNVLKRTYHDHINEISSLQFNWNDTVIASGSKSGQIILNNVVNSVASSPLVCPQKQAVTSLQYSLFKKSLLASGCDCGALNLWDTNRRQLIHGFTSAHINPVTDIAFSPLNEMLLVSVGLDKRLACFDVQGKSPVWTAKAEGPLMAVTLHSNGTTVAVGTSLGKVCIYDLRKGGEPMHTFHAHRTSVRALKFQQKSKMSDTKAKPKKITSASKTSNSVSNKAGSIDSSDSGDHPPKLANGGSLSKQDAAVDIDSQLPSTNQAMGDYVNNNRYLDANGVLSPVGSNDDSLKNSLSDKDKRLFGLSLQRPSIEQEQLVNSRPTKTSENESNHAAVKTLEDLSKEDVCDNQSVPVTVILEPAELSQSTPEAISPKRSAVSTGKQSTAHSVHWAHSVHGRDKLSSDFLPPFKSKVRLTSPDRQSPRFGSPEKQLLRFTSPDQQTTLPQQAWPSPSRKSSGVPSVPVSHEHAETNPRPYISNHVPSNSHSPKSSGESSGSEAAVAQSSKVGERSQETVATGNEGMTPFQMEYMKNLVEDAMEEFRDEIKDSLMHMHVEMIKLFVKQQEEINSQLRQLSINDHLVAEVERLQEENKRLKSLF